MYPHKSILVVGMDPSLRNWGIASGVYHLDTKKLEIASISVINPLLPTGKQVRQNSLDMESGLQLYRGAVFAAKHAHAVFAEPPVGSQSARAMASYGVCMGVLGALRANGIPFFEVTATEAKVAGAGSKTATKRQMINWAVDAHPEANWPRYKEHGNLFIAESQAEHMADAIAAIYAGVNSNAFNQMMLPFQQAA